MKPIKRNPLRFDIFNALTQFTHEERLSLRDPKAIESFAKEIRTSVDTSITSDTFLYGQRTQAMFEALVLSLGQAKLMKQEDAGDLYSIDEQIRVPDLRLVLLDGKQLLIEVKNFYQPTDPFQPFEQEKDYIDGLIKYAELIGCELRIAVYWARWNWWTLVSMNRFEHGSGKSILSYQTSMMFNEMATLGDMMIGCKFPLTLEMETRKDKPRTVEENGKVIFHIAAINILCAHQPVATELERNIAWYLINHGDWEEQPAEAIVNNGQLDGVRFSWLPTAYGDAPEEDDQQGFAVIGTLSGMFSRYYRAVTVEDGIIKRLRIDVSPGQLGQMIPDDYKGTTLPLWRFRQEPKSKEDGDERNE
jgi:hypothetical protein